MNIAQWLYASAKRYASRPALMTGEQVVSNYAEFALKVSSLSRLLQNTFGITAGRRVGLFMKNRIEYLEALYAIWWLGAVAVPINAKLHSKEAAWILNNAEASLVIVSDETGIVFHESDSSLNSRTHILSVDSSVFEEARQPRENCDKLAAPQSCEANDLAWLFYTSGTTGRPKGVMLSHGNLIAMSLCYPIDVDAVSPEDAILYAAPISHGAGLYNFIHVRCGARHVVPALGGFDEHEVLDLAKTLDNVSMFAAPTMVKRLVEAAKARGEHGEGIKTIVYGGGPMYRADIEAGLNQLGPRFVQIYGQGESPMTITALSRACHSDTGHSRYLDRLSSVGVAHSVVEVRTTDTQGNPQSPGEIGEIEVKGATVMLGYWNNPKATAETIKDGWLRTGDMGALDDDGFLTLHDRSKDVIISGGTNIYPREVEEALLTHSDVHEVAVIGQPDPEWGEIVVACVVMAEGKSLETTALDQHCLNTIARFKRPKHYIALDSLPKNNNGKVQKTLLREQLDDTQTEQDA